MKGILRQLGLAPRMLIADLYRVFEDSDAPSIGHLDDREQRLSTLPFLIAAALPEPSARLAQPDVVLGHYATSGTTSLPRVVRITHANIVAQVNEGMDVMNLRKAEDLLNLGPRGRSGGRPQPAAGSG
jgi:long-subunit acyl-CoA synthetase (AMP-forming)